MNLISEPYKDLLQLRAYGWQQGTKAFKQPILFQRGLPLDALCPDQTDQCQADLYQRLSQPKRSLALVIFADVCPPQVEIERI